MTSISIIMPAYKTERYIAEAIESVMTQSFKDWELLIIDDGSPNDLLSIANFYAQKDSRIKVISQPNQGVAVARNIGLELAQGKYIAFLDSDDYWNPLFLEKMIEKMESDPSQGLVYSGYYKERKGKPAKKVGNLFIEKGLLVAPLENHQGCKICAFQIKNQYSMMNANWSTGQIDSLKAFQRDHEYISEYYYISDIEQVLNASRKNIENFNQ